VPVANLKTYLAASAAAAALVAGFPALAQDAAVGDAVNVAADALDTADAATVDQVIVTARRREENAQDVPIALTVFGGGALEAAGVFNVQQITQLAPSLQFGSFNPRNTTVNIRGLGNNVGLANDGLEVGVGFYIDQVYYSRPAAATFDLTDIERIEILRGPQGTLFGKNTTAGALNITTRAPSFTPEARLELTLGDKGFIQTKGSVSGPIGETWAGRLSFATTVRDGLVDNVTTGQEVNDQNSLALRGQLLWKPSDAFSLRLSGDYNRQETDCCLLVFAGVAPTLKPAAAQFEALAAGIGYSPASRNPFDRVTDANDDAKANQELGGVSAIADWDLGGATVTAIASWRFWTWDPANDADFTSLSIIERSENADEQEQSTLELRIASNGERTVDYVAGLYGYWQDIDARLTSVFGDRSTYWLLSPALPGALTNGYRSDGTASSTTKSYAAFGQLTWHVSDRLSITPGLRYTYEEKDARFDSTVSGGLATLNPVLIGYKLALARPQSYTASLSDGSLSGQINVAYDVSDTVLVYANWARGYKSGGINMGGLPVDALGNPIQDRAVIEPEETTAWEVGLKSQLFDKRLTLNLAAFRTDTQDYQANVVDSAGGTLKQYLANVEEVRSQGVELDARLARVGGFSGYASVAYTDAQYVSYENGPCPIERIGPATISCDLSGEGLPGVSEWATTVGGDYERSVSFGSVDGEAYVSGEVSYRSNPASISDYTEVGDLTLVNLRLGFRAEKGWELFLWSRNLFDEEYFQYLSAQTGNSGALYGAPGDPRTVGVTFQARY